MIITTWNTQGDPTPVRHGDDKQKNRNKALRNLLRDSDVILLQECGRLAALDGYLREVKDKTATVEYSPQAGAFNVRCTTAIISFVPGKFHTEYLVSGTGRSAIFLMVESGPAIGTLHAISGGIGATDLSNVITRLNKQTANYIIGGDFNCTPDKTSWVTGRHKMAVGTSRTRIDFSYIAPLDRTHISGGILDWFIYNNVNPTNIKRYHTMGGDHYPVCLTVKK